MTELDHDVVAIATRAREVAQEVARLDASTRNTALRTAAAALTEAAPAISIANQDDLEQARAAGVRGALLDRLSLTPSRLDGMADGLRAVAALPDVLGEVVEEWRRPNGLLLRRVRVPLGVIAVIYEARPNVTSDVAGLCLKSGNACILRGSSVAIRTNKVLVDTLREALQASDVPVDAVQLVSDTGRAAAASLMRCRGLVDLLIPRGGPALIADIVETSTVPYVIDGDGNCHVYVDAAADQDKARRIVLNAKLSKPSVCNAAEKLLVDESIAADFLPGVAAELSAAGVELRGDDGARELVPAMATATDADWDREYLDLVMSVRVVAGVDGAIAHVRAHSSGHTEAIVTEDRATATRFIEGCPSAVVMVNASTRFTDGAEFGYGAEIGNSTQRLHARGPMGVRELTTYRIEVWGDGQVRE
ncbi:MAG: glutamate-5-semialdehyde dehydrogenase [Candidatus Dormibacteraeota bacterium]|uniref:Gamma-glutamyl phosphate reductase n=1 Tax=Candidatus Amunia macphersoniae TaxID=3127014 RepID=A0A934KGA9_9BACT|nr:glutamate-5-semialdehyde dehydrogenase [Candidatus Dormibacteraeota bacterium]